MSNEYLLLKDLVRSNDDTRLIVDTSIIESIINTRLPETIKKYAPSNFPEIYFDFVKEYERLKEFILYDKLIGKNVVALGGGFSSGKSSFLNSLIEQEILPSKVNPSTSVPAYVIYSNKVESQGINAFNARVDFCQDDVRLLCHGFGKDDYDKKEITLGHIINSIFIGSPKLPFKNIAFLDTPGYSKPESAEYSAKTDAKIARTQLNSANYILWFIEADAGTINNADIDFIKSLNRETPILFIITKADEIPPSEVDEVVNAVKSVLKKKGINYYDVLSYSSEEPDDFDKEKIVEYLCSWDKKCSKNLFAFNFMVLFTKCKHYYEEVIEKNRKQLSRVTKANPYADHSFLLKFLDELRQEAIDEISKISEMLIELEKIKKDFFDELHNIGRRIGMEMNEPTEIELLDLRGAK